MVISYSGRDNNNLMIYGYQMGSTCPARRVYLVDFCLQRKGWCFILCMVDVTMGHIVVNTADRCFSAQEANIPNCYRRCTALVPLV